MSMPIEQSVPDDFQDVIDLPEPDQVDQAAVTKATAALAREKGTGAKAKAGAASASRTAKILQSQLKNKKLGPGAKKALQARLKAQQAIVKKQTAVQTASTTKQGTLQNSVYEAGGQYEKLLSGANRDAYSALKSLFNQYGLGSLAGKIYGYIKEGHGADTIALELQDTTEYRTRFAANDARAKAGLAVLSPADYLSTEAAYRQILSSAGLPAGFYDNPADFQRWIASDVSPTEIKDRVDLAVSATGQANPQYKEALFQMYGINEADLTAYFLDRKTAEPILKKQAAAGAIGAAAIRRGFAANTLNLESYATIGITADQAEQAYGQIADGFETMLGIAGRYGTTWNQQQAEQEVFTPGAAATVGAESAAEKGKRLKSQERASFAGGQGSSSAGLSPSYSQT